MPLARSQEALAPASAVPSRSPRAARAGARGALDGGARVAGVFDDLPAALRGLLAFVDAEEGGT